MSLDLLQDTTDNILNSLFKLILIIKAIYHYVHTLMHVMLSLRNLYAR